MHPRRALSATHTHTRARAHARLQPRLHQVCIYTHAHAKRANQKFLRSEQVENRFIFPNYDFQSLGVTLLLTSHHVCVSVGGEVGGGGGGGGGDSEKIITSSLHFTE